MRTAKLLLPLLGAFLYSSGSYAESIVTTPVQDGSAITDGYYAIRLNKKSSGGSDTYNYIYVNTTNRRIEWKKIATSAVDENYVWKVTSTGDGNYSLKNIVSQTYANGTGATSGSGSATISLSKDPQGFKFESLGASTEATNNGEYQYKITNSNITFHCEWAGNQSGNVVTWGGEINTASAWCFEKIDDEIGKKLDEEMKQITSLITIKKTDEKGVVFNTYVESVPKNQAYTLNTASDISYTFASAAIDGVETSENSFTPTETNHTIEYKYKYNLPFVSNEINGSFPEGTHWYLMKIRGNKYVKYNAADNTYIPASTEKGITDEYWWTFSGNYQDGIKVYNKAAGANMVLTTTDSNTKPYMGNPAEISGANDQWTLYPSSLIANSNGFFLSRKGETIKLNDTNGQLAFYSVGDAGSTFTLVSIEDELAPYADYVPSGIYAVGTLKDEVREGYLKLLESKTPDDLRKLPEFIKAENLIQLTGNSYYRLLCLARNGSHYMTVTDDKKLYGKDLNEASASQIWKFVPDGSNYKMISQDIAIKNAGVVSETEAQGYAVTQRDGYAGFYTFRPEGGTDLHLAGGFDIVGWNHGNAAGKDDASSWMIVPAENIEVIISDAEYATVHYPFSVQVPENVIAYTGVLGKDKDILILNEIKDGKIPANTPAILSAAQGTYSLNILNENVAAITENDLDGTLLSESIVTNAYILGNSDKGFGFYKVDESDRTLAANKAYLVLPDAIAQSIRSIIISDGQTTGIEETVTNGSEEEYYDLQGRRVMNPTKGIYVTKSGKKVFINK